MPLTTSTDDPADLDPSVASPVYNNERNRLLANNAGETYQYDDAGFVVERGGTALTWTASGRLLSYDDVQLAWDLDGRLVARTKGSITTHYRFGGRVETDALGSPMFVDHGFAKVRTDGAETYFRHKDFRGNVKFLTDATGSVVAHYGYDTWMRDSTMGVAIDDFGFAGGLEIGGGLVLLGARVYDSRAGRFLSKDPTFGFINQYVYADGDPVGLWDPDGKEPRAAGSYGSWTPVSNESFLGHPLWGFDWAGLPMALYDHPAFAQGALIASVIIIPANLAIMIRSGTASGGLSLSETLLGGASIGWSGFAIGSNVAKAAEDQQSGLSSGSAGARAELTAFRAGWHYKIYYWVTNCKSGCLPMPQQGVGHDDTWQQFDTTSQLAQ